MITPDQIRAARALKGWSQSELAERAGVATPSIANIELGKQKPSAQMLEKIQEAMLLAGIEFTKHGVTKKSPDERITSVTQADFEGKNLYLSLLEDVYFTLRDAPEEQKELLEICVVDEISPPEVVAMLRKIREAGIRFRCLVCEEHTYLMGELSEYRLIPSKQFVNSLGLIYGEKYAVALDSSMEKPEPGAFVIFNDINVANAQRGLFEVMWKSLPSPKKTTAKEKY